MPLLGSFLWWLFDSCHIQGCQSLQIPTSYCFQGGNSLLKILEVLTLAKFNNLCPPLFSPLLLCIIVVSWNKWVSWRDWECVQRYLCSVSFCRCLSSPSLTSPCSYFLFLFPLAGLESGHIPGAVNIPFQSFLTETGHEKSIEEIQQMFREKKVDLSKPLTITCRKGVTACHIALAAYLCGKPDVSIYDGSWSEWFHRAPPEYKVSEMKRNKA